MPDDGLAAFVERVSGESRLRVEADLGDGFVRLRSAEAERRQAAHDIRSSEDIVIEMLRNARDAGAAHIFLAATRDGQTRRLVMVDDGEGIPAAMHERVFEPRVTSKLDTMHMDKWGVHGRGMALYSISVNARSARIAASAPGLGSSFVVETDLGSLGEKTDQSTFPTFTRTDAGVVNVRGPRNIMRTACEFALECRGGCTVYVGSATDVAATLYAFGLTALADPEHAAGGAALERLPVAWRLAASTDPASFAACAADLGLLLSERSARRIRDGQIEPLPPLLSLMRIGPAPAGAPAVPEKHAAPRQHPHARGDARGLRVDAADLELFSERIAAAFSELARDYYLDPDVTPQVRVGKDAIRVKLPVVKLR